MISGTYCSACGSWSPSEAWKEGETFYGDEGEFSESYVECPLCHHHFPPLDPPTAGILQQRPMHYSSPTNVAEAAKRFFEQSLPCDHTVASIDSSSKERGMTGIHTHTITNTLEEAAVLDAVETCWRGMARKASWTIEAIQAIVDSNVITKTGGGCPAWLTPVVLGQLIERGLVYRCATEPESYTRA